jgi:hypothetical protein
MVPETYLSCSSESRGVLPAPPQDGLGCRFSCGCASRCTSVTVALLVAASDGRAVKLPPPSSHVAVASKSSVRCICQLHSISLYA